MRPSKRGLRARGSWILLEGPLSKLEGPCSSTDAHRASYESLLTIIVSDTLCPTVDILEPKMSECQLEGSES